MRNVERRAAERRTRRRRRAIVASVVALTAVLVLGGAVKLAVDHLDFDFGFDFGGEPPRADRCYATADDGTVVGLKPLQAGNAATITAVTMARGLPPRASAIAVATARQESSLFNLDHGDRDSVGLFQQRPSQGWGTVEQLMDPVYATNAFLDVLVTIDGWDTRPLTEVAQDVQRSGFPDAYADHELMATTFADALTGTRPRAVTCELPEATDTASSGLVEVRLIRDFGEIPVVIDGDTVTADADALAARLGSDPATTRWAVAQWAVANASELGIDSVTVDGSTWDRAGSWTDPASASASPQPSTPTGSVVITVHDAATPS